MKLHSVVGFASLAVVASGAAAQTAQKQFELPPSSSTRGSVPYISDLAMQGCVRLYNEAKWLREEIDRTRVDRYSQSSVNSYNSRVRRHSDMISTFNRDCAGKQSESAWRAAQELNKK